MRRAPIVLTATVAGLALVLGHHTHPRALPAATAMPSAQASPSSSVPARPTRVVTGADVPNQYGDVQVRLTLSGQQIVRVAAVRLPDAGGRSQDISAYAGPLLAQQALTAQGAAIDGVSGASYTSEGYRESLQSAIDQAGG